MQSSHISSLFILATLGVMGCSGSGATDSPSQGGSAQVGGGETSGGATATGGSLSGGGSLANGGSVTTTGGRSSTGGNVQTGGSRATGGSRNGTPTGGAYGTGGNVQTGGAHPTGGAVPTGGTKATGGAAPTGGANATGGMVPTGGAKATGGATSNGSTLNPPITGTNGTTTRYWDCAKPSCGWTANANPPAYSCDSNGMTHVGVNTQSGWDTKNKNGAFECYNFAPWYDAGTNLSYGFVAFNGANCGTCFELQFTGGSISGKQMIVQVVNVGNISANQFDVLIPGGGVGINNACQYQWPGLNIGSQNGGFLTAANGNGSSAQTACHSAFTSLTNGAQLVAGCDWFAGWFASANNPNVIYKQVTCPSQLKQVSGM